jgi:acyl-CoA thioesterase-2
VSAAPSLAGLLRVARDPGGDFVAQLRDWGNAAAFGGDAIARATLAAALDCEGKHLHALHASFLRPVPAAVPLRIRVEALSEGRRLARRRVRVERDERLLCDVTASFASAGEGVGWQELAPPPGVPAPEELRSDDEIAREEKWESWNIEHEEIEWRWVGRPWEATTGPGESSVWLAWVRPRVPLPDDPSLHAAALAYLSDHGSHWCAARRVGAAFDWAAFASAEHALFVHRPLLWDDWWLLTNAGDVASDGRAFWRREVFARDGRLIASIAQHGLVATRAGDRAP